MRSAKATTTSTNRLRQIYFLLARFWCQLAQMRFSLAYLVALQVQNRSSPMMSSLSPCSKAKLLVQFIILCTFIKLFDTLLIQAFFYLIILCSISKLTPYSSYSSQCDASSLIILCSASQCLQFCLFEVQPAFFLVFSTLIDVKVVICESLDPLSVCFQFFVSAQTDCSSCFLLSFCILNCCLIVPILRAVSGSRQDCSSFWMRFSIFYKLSSMAVCYLFILREMVVGDYTPHALLRQSLLFLSYLIREMASSQLALNSLRIQIQSDSLVGGWQIIQYCIIHRLYLQTLAKTINSDSNFKKYVQLKVSQTIIRLEFITYFCIMYKCLLFLSECLYFYQIPILFQPTFYLQTALQYQLKFEFMFQTQQQQQPCVMCHQPNEQMLMLSCVHDPCVNCAATHYVQNQPHNSPIYTCAKCGQQTELDQSSVMQLQRIYNTLKNKKRYRNQPASVSSKEKLQNRNYNNDSYESKETRQYAKPRASELQSYQRSREYDQTPTSKYAPVSQPSYTSAANKKGAHQIMYPCSDHQEEQLTYFCFTCNRPICPQCAIHGLHKDHEVQTTRKAIKKIKQLLGEDKQKLDSALNDLSSNRDRAKRLSKQWTDQNKRDQDFIRKKLAQLKNAIAEKQKDLLRSTDINLQKNCEILRNEAVASDRTIDNINGVRRQIQVTLKKQDLVVLQQFNKRDEEANEVLQVADREKDKIREQQLKNPLKTLDLDLFEEDIDRLIGDIQTIKLSTCAPKT